MVEMRYAILGERARNHRMIIGSSSVWTNDNLSKLNEMQATPLQTFFLSPISHEEMAKAQVTTSLTGARVCRWVLYVHVQGTYVLSNYLVGAQVAVSLAVWLNGQQGELTLVKHEA